MRAFTLAALLALLAPPLARAECEVTGVASIDRLRVRIPGEPLRTLSVIDSPVAVRPGSGSMYRDVRVLAPLSFTARTDAPIPWTISRPGGVADGMLWLSPEAEVEDVRERGDDLIVRVQVDAGVWISRLHLPCSSLSVGHAEGGAEPPDWGANGGPRWNPRGEDIWLMSDAGSGASLRLDAPEGLASPLIELERRGGWLRVAARFGSGAVLRGWVRQHHLELAGPGPSSRPPYRRARSLAPAPSCSHSPPARNEYVGPAQLRPGAHVRIDPRGPAWASIAEPAVVTIRWRTGSDWVRIVHVPGLRSDDPCPEALTRAWVPRSAVLLQNEGR